LGSTTCFTFGSGVTSAYFHTDGNFCSLYDELRMSAIGWYSSSYFSVVIKIRENAPDKANDLRLVSREPRTKNFLVPKGHLERYHVAVLEALISLDKLRT